MRSIAGGAGGGGGTPAGITSDSVAVAEPLPSERLDSGAGGDGAVVAVAGPGLKTYRVAGGGLIIQGGADATRHFYRHQRLAAGADEAAPQVSIVNVARRVGSASAQRQPGGTIFWLPMHEGERKQRCAHYLRIYGAELLESLRQGRTVVVNCQEGLHRSVEFARQLLTAATAAPSLLAPSAEPTEHAAPEPHGAPASAACSPP